MEPTIMGPVDSFDGRECPGCHELPCWSARCLEETAHFPRQSRCLLGQGPYLLLMMAHGGELNKCLFSDWITRGLWWARSIAAGIGFSTAAQPHPASIKLFCGSFWEKINKHMFEMSFLFWMSTTFLILQVLPELLKNQVKIYSIPHPEFPYPPSRAASPGFSKWTDFPFILWACPTWNFLGYLCDCGLCRNIDELGYSGSQCCSHLEDVEMVLRFQSRFGYSLFDYLIVASVRMIMHIE